MDITPLPSKGRLIINRYGNGGFVVNETAYKGNILLLADRVVNFTIPEAGLFAPEIFQPFFDVNPLPEILLIGTGGNFLPALPAMGALLRARHIPFDVMDTGAACRTYNVLLAEDRRVNAALIAV